jgi:transposase-like protein
MVRQETGIGYCRVVKMLALVRRRMDEAMPRRFSGTCEADETFIGGQRKNKRLHIRRRPCKRGHGTEKIPITGVFCRKTGQVAAQVLPHRSEETVVGFMVSCLAPDARLYTDVYKMNRAVRKHGVIHEYVDHASGEYVRGDVHTNSIEGFWGFMKKHLALIGGIKPPRFQLFVAEIVWRFNHRRLSRKQQADVLMNLIFPS